MPLSLTLDRHLRVKCLRGLCPWPLLVGIYMIYILGFALLKPSVAPAFPMKGHMIANSGKVFLTLVPPLALIFLFWDQSFVYRNSEPSRRNCAAGR